jgi:hypothetical protein
MSDQHELEERVKTAQAECERLREENVRLRAMLSIHDPVLEHPPRRHQALRPRLYLAAASPRPLHLSRRSRYFGASFAGKVKPHVVVVGGQEEKHEAASVARGYGKNL